MKLVYILGGLWVALFIGRHITMYVLDRKLEKLKEEQGKEWGLLQLRLIEARKKAGMTQEELANKIGISVVSYGSKENGKIDFKLSECFKIAKILNKDFSDIFSN